MSTAGTKIKNPHEFAKRVIQDNPNISLTQLRRTTNVSKTTLYRYKRAALAKNNVNKEALKDMKLSIAIEEALNNLRTQIINSIKSIEDAHQNEIAALKSEINESKKSKEIVDAFLKTLKDMNGKP